MAQFRTVADLKTEILQKAGEPTNGNSAYDSLAMTYLNKAHQLIIGGGNIFSAKVDEAWKWAEHRYPIILELQPALTTGTVTFTQNSRSITFSSAPTASVEGWYVQGTGDKSVYRVTQHTAASTAATIESGYMETTGSKGYKCFKLDYDIMPTYIVVDSRNDKIDFIEVGTTQITATLVHGTYTPDEYIAHVVVKLNAAGTGPNYSGSYDSILKLFTLSSTLGSGKLFKLSGATGTNRRRSALPSLGLDLLDTASTASYVSTYIIGGISRLVAPFKIYANKISGDPFIYGMDQTNMELEYPLCDVQKRTPTHFCFLREDNEGSRSVHFNTYPDKLMKVEIPWVPIPIDLQNNDASYPLVPRKDIDVLIHAAAAFILFDKEDTKFGDVMKLVEGGLLAMEKKNRSEQFRTAQYFGQQIVREDYVKRRGPLRYGYTADN